MAQRYAMGKRERERECVRERKIFVRCELGVSCKNCISQSCQLPHGDFGQGKAQLLFPGGANSKNYNFFFDQLNRDTGSITIID